MCSNDTKYVVLPSADLMHCELNSCLNGGTCQEMSDTFQCLCPQGYEGGNCELGTFHVRVVVTGYGLLKAVFVVATLRFGPGQTVLSNQANSSQVTKLKLSSAGGHTMPPSRASS